MRHATTFAAALVIASPVAAHHSDAGLDMESVIAFEGTVAEFNWRNPHVYVTVETTDERGESVEWTVQLSGLNGLSRRGWTRESLANGDRIRVRSGIRSSAWTGSPWIRQPLLRMSPPAHLHKLVVGRRILQNSPAIPVASTVFFELSSY
jgi:hypothetical protein